jgi:hypothetical protein
MEALAILYRRWITEENLPSFVAMASAASARDFVKGFRDVVQELPQKLAQIVGFYKGVLGRGIVARPTTSPGTVPGPSPGVVPVSSIEREIFLACEEVIGELRKILRE